MRETLRFFSMAILAGLALFGLAMLLSGCETAKYVECVARDNTRNPCN